MIKVENVAAKIRYASPEDISSVLFNTGIRKELIPNAKPIAKNIIPTNASGIIKLPFLFIFLKII